MVTAGHLHARVLRFGFEEPSAGGQEAQRVGRALEKILIRRGPSLVPVTHLATHLASLLQAEGRLGHQRLLQLRAHAGGG